MPRPLDRPRAELHKATLSRLKGHSLFLKLFNSVLIAGAAAAAGIAQFLTWPEGTPPAPAQVVGITATAVVFLAAVVNHFGEKNTADEVAAAHSAQREAEVIQEKLNETFERLPDIDRILALVEAHRLMRDGLEGAVVGELEDEAKLAALMMRVAELPLLKAAGFRTGDLYTVSLYQARRAPDGCRFELHLVEDLRALPCDRTEARVWPEGRGATGIAFSKAAEIIVPDLTNPTARSIFDSPDLHKNYDDDRYLSIVAVPIMVQGDTHPWGIVASTNDLPAHFNHLDEDGIKNEEAIRALAHYAALAVAIARRRQGGPGAASPVP
jgi:hypothetical protein